MLIDPDVKNNFEKLQWKFIFIAFNKASNNFAFVCRKYYISKLLVDISPNKNKNLASIYSQTKYSKEDLLKLTSKTAKELILK